MSQQIKILKEGVGIRGEKVKEGTLVTVLPDATRSRELLAKPLQIRKSVAINLVAKGKAELVKGSSSASSVAEK